MKKDKQIDSASQEEGKKHSHQHDCNEGRCGHNHEHNHNHNHGAKAFIAPAVSFTMLILGLLMSHFQVKAFESNYWFELVWYVLAFLPVGLPVIKEAIEGIANKDFFNEFTLMSIACIGAFCIHELPEAVGVMLFYSLGETLQHGAVDRATRNISKLLDVRGEKATVLRNGQSETVTPKDIKVGEIIVVNPGERVPLDGELESKDGIFDTSALTGESMPREIAEGEEVLAGMISTQKSVKIRVSREYAQSALSRILDMVNNASSRKAHAELFIRKFARVYTPIVIVLATLLVLVPYIIGLFSPEFKFVWSEWIYRALVFLVISCPCALVISVPLGYFAGIGIASRLGILFKGGNYLEAVREINAIAFDKTGTLTTGKFSVESVAMQKNVDEEKMLAMMASAESGSSHPLAKALVDYVKARHIEIPEADSMNEKAGYGTSAKIGDDNIIAGSLKMLKAEGIEFPKDLKSARGTIIACALNGVYAGYVVLADTVKEDSQKAIESLKTLGVNDIVMLSGDRKEIVSAYAAALGINEAYGELLPQDKAEYVEKIASTPGRKIAFVGDGMNDAPVLALSDVGVAMGGLGSDVAIESADIVIQTDQPSRIATAIKIGRTTHRIVTENIVGAIGIKVIILALGALGYASLWAAVFADVGVALLAVLNSMRIMWKKY
ncbi:MAG: heavy metal translocating P-type ATPase [Muribaculaceae bacterium]|nr:heavy metal translocating P-type ATPase [Muribaculaceae bacterium]